MKRRPHPAAAGSTLTGVEHARDTVPRNPLSKGGSVLRQHKSRNSGAVSRLAVAALVVGCIVWPAAAMAAPQHANQSRVVTANSQTYTDPTGDSGNAPDVTSVTASNDNAGQVTFAIGIGNRTSLAATDILAVRMDTDQNSADGLNGADYQIAALSSQALLFSATGGTLNTFTPAHTFSASFANGVETISVNAADIGSPKQINFSIGGSGDTAATFAESAPDSGTWNYQVIGAPPPPPLKLVSSAVHVSKAQAGKLFTADMVVKDSSTGAGVMGVVTCSARLAGKPLAALRHTSAAIGTATCVWKLPKTSRGKQFKGTISETYKGKKVSRSFTVKVK
jgi:hypothetical protein